jgi:NADPH2:quinone reductase
MTALRLHRKADAIDDLGFELVDQQPPSPGPDQCLIEVRSAAVNMSDAKAALGQMPHARWPRTPGRDYAGVVIEGPTYLKGQEVWGSGGDLGITRDGTHSRYLVLDASSVRPKSVQVSLLQAGTIGVPFVTAFEGLRRAGGLAGKSSILICGANGRVGEATAQLACAAGLTVFGVARSDVTYRGHSIGSPVEMIDTRNTSISEHIRNRTGGRGVDLVFNTVGSPYFAEAHAAMAKNSTQILIATIDRGVPFDILRLYRGQHTFVGVDTLALDSAACASILGELTPMFDSGALKPFPIEPDGVFDLDHAASAYRMVYEGSARRVVLTP